MVRSMTIGDLARAADTKAETIRYYERIGLLGKPGRTASNYRAYGEVEVARLTFVRRARTLGFSIDDIRALLDLSDDRQKSCCAVDEIARAHLAEVDKKIADLEALRRELGSVIAQCSQGTIADCRIIDALGPVAASE